MTLEELSCKINSLEERIDRFELIDKKCNNSIFSTIKCPVCGAKTEASSGGNTISFFCTNENCHGKSQMLTVEEIAAIMNFNPLT